MAITDDPQLYSSGYERNRLDRYWTNPWMTRELVGHPRISNEIHGFIWEPAAGRGDISRELTRSGYAGHSSDLDMSEFDYSIGSGHEGSFLDEVKVPYVNGVSCGSIITNPPYNTPRGIAADFVRHGLKFLNDDYESDVTFMAMLLRSEFRSAKTRDDMFGHCQHYLGELVLTTRPRWDYGEPNAPEHASPRHNFSCSFSLICRKGSNYDRN